MISTKVRNQAHASGQAAQLSKAMALRLVRSSSCQAGFRLGCAVSRQHSQPSRSFSSTSPTQLRDFFPVQDTPHIQKTKPAWPHHGYTLNEMAAVVPAHRIPEGFGEWAAWKIVRVARYWMDKATGMSRAQQVDKKHPTTSVVADKPLTEAQWVSLSWPFLGLTGK